MGRDPTDPEPRMFLVIDPGDGATHVFLEADPRSDPDFPAGTAVAGGVYHVFRSAAEAEAVGFAVVARTWSEYRARGQV